MTLFEAIDYAAPEFVADPYPYYAKLLAQGDCFYDEDARSWRIAGHAAVTQLLQDKRMSSNMTIDKKVYPRQVTDEMLVVQEYCNYSLLYLDPPKHSQLRKVLAPFFSQAPIALFEEALIQYCQDLLADRVVAFDYVQEVAFKLPGIMMLAFLGFPIAKAEQFVLDALQLGHFVDALFCPATVYMPIYKIICRHDAFINKALDAMSADMPAKKIMQALIDQGVVHPGDSWQVLSILIMTGIETSTASLAASTYTLLKDKTLYQSLCNSPSLIDSAVDELLRVEPPAHLTIRIAREDIKIGGQVIKAGDLCRLYLAAANRDSSVFKNPNRVLLDRDPNPHLSFGSGIHYCLGRLLGKMISQVNLKVMTSYYPKLALADADVTWQMQRYFRHLTSLTLQPST